ncbi:hypothetical protein [Elizabethkingia meningoseptica]|uniref:hypothetical protein n=2 Tax=Elizabethkingia meningoseptica TaxID=238 RepID=UPI003018E8DF
MKLKFKKADFMEKNYEKQKDENLKKKYIKPEVDVIWIEMEQGIVAASGKIIINGNTPEIENWEDGENFNTEYEY